MPERTKVFISYSHSDTAWLDKVRKALKPLEKDHGDAIWHDQKLEPGSAWADDIQGALDAAKVAVLLVSRDFMASDFIGGKELPPLLKAAKDDGAIILPLHVGRSAFVEDKHLGRIQGVNDPAKPLKAVSEDEQDQALENLRRSVHKALVGPAAIAAAAKSVAIAAKTVADAAQTVAAAQSAAEEADDEEDADDELVDGLTPGLEALTADDPDITGLHICAVADEGDPLILMSLARSDDDELVMVVLGTEDLPEDLALDEDARARLEDEYEAISTGDDDDDDMQAINFGPVDEIDLDKMRDMICTILDDIFQLPDDDYGLIATPVSD